MGGGTELHLRRVAGAYLAGTNAASTHHTTADADPAFTDPCAFSYIEPLIYGPRVIVDTGELISSQPGRLSEHTNIQEAMEGLAQYRLGSSLESDASPVIRARATGYHEDRSTRVFW